MATTTVNLGLSLDGLSNVDTTGKANGNTLVWNSGTNKWEDAAPSSGITIGTTPISSGTDGRVLFQAAGVVQQDANFTFNNTEKRLTLRAGGATVSDIPFIVRNNGDTYNILACYGNELTIIGRNESIEPRLLINRAGSTRMLLGGTTDLNITFPSTGMGQINSGAQGLDIISSSGDIKTRNSSTFTLLKGNFFGIGTNTPAARLDVRAQGALSTDIAFRIRNSANTYDMVSSKGNGVIDIRDANGSLSIGGAGSVAAGSVVISYPGGTATGGLRSVSVGGNTNSGGDGVAIGFEVKVNTASTGGVGVGQYITGGGLSFGTNISNTGSLVFGRDITAGGSGLTNNSMALFGKGMTENSGSANMPYTFGFGWYAAGTANKAGLSFRSNNMNHLLVGYHTTDASYSNTTGTNWVGVKNGTAPAGQVDGFQLYSAAIVAGNACAHFRNENGSIIKLYQQSSAGITTVADLVTILQNIGLLS